MRLGTVRLATMLLIQLMPSLVWPADPEVLRPRVPLEQLDTARQVTNPYPATPEIIEDGKQLFEGKPFAAPVMASTAKAWGPTSSREV